VLPVEQTIHVALRANPQRRLTTFHDFWSRAGWVWHVQKGVVHIICPALRLMLMF